jgi:superfamily I DNA/RNA helicase
VPRHDAGWGTVAFSTCPDAGAELMSVYGGIARGDTSPNEIAVLARTNALADNVRNCLRGLCVPVKFAGTIVLPEDWRFALSCISLLIDPSNDYHAERVMRGRGMHQFDINVAKLRALNAGLPLSTYGLQVPTATASLYGALAALQLMGVGLESSNLIHSRIELLPNENPTLSDLLSDLWNHEKWNPQEAQDGVFVGTIHGAKGKEWDAVYVIGCEEGILPSLKTDSDIEEERRLMFVAMTRARHSLQLTWARTRTAYGKTTTQIPSRFLEECQ